MLGAPYALVRYLWLMTAGHEGGHAYAPSNGFHDAPVSKNFIPFSDGDVVLIALCNPGHLVFLESSVTDKPTDIGPYKVPAGVAVWVQAHSVHNCPRNFTRPIEFWPERWTTTEVCR